MIERNPVAYYESRPAKIHVGGKWFVLAEDLTFWAGTIVSITVPRGYVTDLASIPRWAQCLISKTDDHVRAAIVHDYLCEMGVVSRTAADGLFFDLLGADGVSIWKQWAMYFAVRIGAFLPGTIKPPAEILREAKTQIKKRS